jgi:hypothetical protein
VVEAILVGCGAMSRTWLEAARRIAATIEHAPRPCEEAVDSRPPQLFR